VYNFERKHWENRPIHKQNSDVSFPEKLRKIVATKGEVFSLKFSKNRLAAEPRPVPLAELKRPPKSHSRNNGGYF